MLIFSAISRFVFLLMLMRTCCAKDVKASSLLLSVRVESIVAYLDLACVVLQEYHH